MSLCFFLCYICKNDVPSRDINRFIESISQHTVWFSVHITSFPFHDHLILIHLFPYTASVIHRRGESMHLWRRFPPLPLTSHLMLVSLAKAFCVC